MSSVIISECTQRKIVQINNLKLNYIRKSKRFSIINNYHSFWFGSMTIGRHKFMRAAHHTWTIWSTTGVSQPFWRQTIDIGNFPQAKIGYLMRNCPIIRST